MPADSTTQTPAWVAEAQKATETETRSQPWKEAISNSTSLDANHDNVNVETEPEATRAAI